MARRPRLDRELERYLVTGENAIVAVRRHWFHLVGEASLLTAATVFAFWVDIKVPHNAGGEVLQTISLAVWWGSAAWFVWRVANWRHEWFVATDKRFLLFYGFIRRKVAMMPLLKVTDMTYDRSLLGRIVGYGTFVLESAGQGQALSVITHVPDADRHYRAICTQLFGPGAQLRFQPGGGPGSPPPPRDDGYPGGGGGPPSQPDAGGPAPAVPSPAARPRGEPELPSPISGPESWYRSSNLAAPSHLGDTGEIPVVRIPGDDPDEDARLYPPPHWVD